MKKFLNKDLVIPRSVLLMATFLALLFSAAVIYNTLLATQASTKADNAIHANKVLLEETSQSDHGLLQQIHGTTVVNCNAIEVIKGQLRRNYQRGLKSLPTISYYRTHPVELGMAVAELKASIADLHKHQCQTTP